jgi:hypothetical protein
VGQARRRGEAQAASAVDPRSVGFDNEFDLARRDGLRHHLGRRRGLGILADRQWRILHRSIDLAMGDTRANQNNETDNGG